MNEPRDNQGQSAAPSTPPRHWMTVRQAAEYLGVCEKTIRRGYLTGGLRATRVGWGRGTIRIERVELERWARGEPAPD